MGAHAGSFELHITIGRPPEAVYAHLAEPTNFLGLQPLLVRMSPVARGSVAGRPLLSYETVEALRVGGVVVAHNRIAVRTLLTRAPRRIDSFVSGAAGLVMLATYLFEGLGGATRLTERIAISVHPLLLPGVLATARRVQRETLGRLRARLEGAADQVY